MKGLELSRAYFEAYGAPMLKEQFPEWSGQIAVGLIGSGSECFGYDDELSQDHDFEIGFCLFIPGEEKMDRRSAFLLERAYAKLPGEFMGYQKSRLNPVGGNRHGVIRLNEFLQEKTGCSDGILSVKDWLTLPEQGLFELSKGTLFQDPGGLVQPVLDRLSRMPEEIRLKKLAGELLMMAQAGQYNYPRCLARGESGAAQLAVGVYVRACLHSLFLLSRQYMPYYKWQFRALSELPLFIGLSEPLEYLLSSGNGPEDAAKKAALMEELAGVLIETLMDQGLTDAVCGDLEKHAYSVNDHISDAGIRNLHILAAV